MSTLPADDRPVGLPVVPQPDRAGGRPADSPPGDRETGDRATGPARSRPAIPRPAAPAPSGPAVGAPGPSVPAPSGGRRRRTGRGTDLSTRQHLVAREPAEFEVWMSVFAGVPVVACDGRLGPASLRACSTAFARAVRLRPHWIVADLTHATLDDDSVPVLGLMHRFAARHGVKLVLAALPPRAQEVLRRCGVEDQYEVQPTLPQALASTAVDAHRSRPRG